MSNDSLKEIDGFLDQLEAKVGELITVAKPGFTPIYQVEGTVKKDDAGNITRLEWVDVSFEDAEQAWNDYGLLVRTVYIKDEQDPLTVVAQRPALLNVTLKMTTTVCHKIDYSDLAVWAAEQLGIRNLEFGDTPNDTDYDFDAVSRHSSRFWDQAAIDATVDAAKAHLYLPMHEVGNLLSYFADAGLLPEGNYIVNVSW